MQKGFIGPSVKTHFSLTKERLKKKRKEKKEALLGSSHEDVKRSGQSLTWNLQVTMGQHVPHIVRIDQTSKLNQKSNHISNCFKINSSFFYPFSTNLSIYRSVRWQVMNHTQRFKPPCSHFLFLFYREINMILKSSSDGIP